MYEEIGVSIITPAYNSDEFLPTTIDSVLNQSHQLFELIIIEDMGSKPTSLNITDPRIRILKNTLERGAGVARYVGIKNSKYPLIAFIDSDDIWHKTKLADQIEYMKKFDMSFSFTGYQTSKNNNIIGEYIANEAFSFSAFLGKKITICCSSVMFDKSHYHDIDVPRLKKRNDYELWAQLFQNNNEGKGRVGNIPQCLTIRRIHHNNLTKNIWLLPYYNFLFYFKVTASISLSLYWMLVNIINTLKRIIKNGA